MRVTPRTIDIWRRRRVIKNSPPFRLGYFLPGVRTLSWMVRPSTNRSNIPDKHECRADNGVPEPGRIRQRSRRIRGGKFNVTPAVSFVNDENFLRDDGVIKERSDRTCLIYIRSKRVESSFSAA